MSADNCEAIARSIVERGLGPRQLVEEIALALRKTVRYETTSWFGNPDYYTGSDGVLRHRAGMEEELIDGSKM